MRYWIIAAALMLPTQQAGVRVGDGVLPAPALTVVAPVYRTSGQTDGSAAPIADGQRVYVYGRQSYCDRVVSATTASADISVGWSLGVRTIGRTPTAIIVKVEWQRLPERATRTVQDELASLQLTLHAGDRVPLDYVAARRPTEQCDAVGLGLELRVAPAPAPVTAELVRPIGLDVWLVHRWPSGAEDVQRQTLTVNDRLIDVTFNAVPVSSSDGLYSVVVTGQLSAIRRTSAALDLMVSMRRSAFSVAVPSRREVGGFGKSIPLPAPGQVVAFEMPPFVDPVLSPLLAGHRFSIRLRLR